MRKIPNCPFRTLLQIGPWAQYQESKIARTQVQSITKTQTSTFFYTVNNDIQYTSRKYNRKRWSGYSKWWRRFHQYRYQRLHRRPQSSRQFIGNFLYYLPLLFVLFRSVLYPFSYVFSGIQIELYGAVPIVFSSVIFNSCMKFSWKIKLFQKLWRKLMFIDWMMLQFQWYEYNKLLSPIKFRRCRE